MFYNIRTFIVNVYATKKYLEMSLSFNLNGGFLPYMTNVYTESTGIFSIFTFLILFFSEKYQLGQLGHIQCITFSSATS